MISALRLMLLFLMVALAGQVLGVGALQVDIYDYDAAIKSNVEAEILSDRQKYTYDGTLILSNDIGIAKNFRAPNLQNRYFIAFIDDFIAAKRIANPLQEALSKAKSTKGHPNQVMHELDDGTRVLFRKDFGNQSHNIGGPFQGKGKIDHYNVQIQNAKGKTIENLHIVPDGKGGFVRFGKDGVVK